MSDCRAGFSRAGFRSDPNGPNKTQTENLGDGKVIDLLHALQWWDGGGGDGAQWSLRVAQNGSMVITSDRRDPPALEKDLNTRRPLNTI